MDRTKQNMAQRPVFEDETQDQAHSSSDTEEEECKLVAPKLPENLGIDKEPWKNFIVTVKKNVLDGKEEKSEDLTSSISPMKVQFLLKNRLKSLNIKLQEHKCCIGKVLEGKVIFHYAEKDIRSADEIVDVVISVLEEMIEKISSRSFVISHAEIADEIYDYTCEHVDQEKALILNDGGKRILLVGEKTTVEISYQNLKEFVKERQKVARKIQLKDILSALLLQNLEFENYFEDGSKADFEVNSDSKIVVIQRANTADMDQFVKNMNLFLKSIISTKCRNLNPGVAKLINNESVQQYLQKQLQSELKYFFVDWKDTDVVCYTRTEEDGKLALSVFKTRFQTITLSRPFSMSAKFKEIHQAFSEHCMVLVSDEKTCEVIATNDVACKMLFAASINRAEILEDVLELEGIQFTHEKDQLLEGRSQGIFTKLVSAQRSRGGAGNQQNVLLQVSIPQDVKLHKAENAWKPSHKIDKQAEDPEAIQSEDILKKARSILNKLTPQKFQTLVKQMAELEIDSEDRLKGVTNLIFEKAIREPRFGVAYASLCRYLTQLKVPSETAVGGFINFRAILLTRCQREFEKDKDDQRELDQRRKELELERETEKRKKLQENLETAEQNARYRSLGNIRFIGELFKLKMLTEGVMHECVLKLMRVKDSESLECLCHLFFTIGKELDTDRARPRIDQYFNQMNKIIIEKKTSARIRFILQDALELRQNKWVPRRDGNKPKTIVQIHKEVELEEQERAFMLQQKRQDTAGGKRLVAGGGGSQRGSRGQNPPQPVPSLDGWNTVGKPRMNVRQPIDPSRLKITKQMVDDGGGTLRFTGWQRGSTGDGARTSQEVEKPASAPSNSKNSRQRFDATLAFGEKGHQQDEKFGHPSTLVITPRPSQEILDNDRAAAVHQSARTITNDRTTLNEDHSREASSSKEKRGEKPATSAKQLTVEEMEKKTIAILDEFLHLQDIKEAIKCVEELNSPSTLNHFVSTALNHVLERSEVARQQTGQLLHDLVKKEIVSIQNYLSGLDTILKFAEDMEIDIPKIWQYFGELIGPMVQDGSVPLSFLKQACEPLKPINKAGQLVAEVLYAASHREGHKKVGDLWKSSGLQWSDFVPAEEIKQFLKDKKLEFTCEVDESSPSTTPTIAISMEKVQDELNRLLTTKASTNEEVFEWIEANLDDRATKSKTFVRALMTSVCSSAISGSGDSAKVDPREIKNRGSLLQKYLDHQADFELQALYALQSLLHNLGHPPGVLRTLFDTLYDEDIISEEAFNRWEKSTDPAEQEGKDVAMKQVTQFFTWLEEAADASDS